MSLESDFLGWVEEHSPDGIRSTIDAGVSATTLIKGRRPIDCLIEGYLRSPRFADSLRVLLQAGATVGDPLLEAVLLDDEPALRRALEGTADGVHRRLHAPCAFTSCYGVTALHICAEFNSLHCARVLLDAGADVNARADVDASGFGGQTPIFHTVNSIHNYCRPMLELLVEAGADLDIRLHGLIWCGGFEWETTLLDVTPLSYAQNGTYPQFHRAEADVWANLAFLYRKRYGRDLPVRNVPNRYLAPHTKA